MEVALHELGEIFTGNTPSKKNKNYWNSEDTVFIKPNDLNNNNLLLNDKNNEYISKEALAQARIVGRNSILVTCIGTIGKIAITTDAKTAFNQQINAIVPNKNVYTKYLAYALMHYKPRLAALANAPVVPIINKKQFSNFKINLNLDKEIQYTVIRQLDLVGEIIKNKNRQLSKLDELIKARFVEMFGDPFNNQKKFNMVKLGDIAELISGGTPSRKNMRFYNGNIPFITTVALGHTYIESKHAQDFITIEGVKNSSTKIIRKNTLLVGSRVGVGKTSITDTDVAINQDIVALNNIDLQSYDLFYLKAVLDKYQYYFDLQKRGATIKGITAKIIKQVQIPVAPIELQEDYHYFVQQVDKSKVAVQKSLDETQKLFDSLMQEYFG
ncbi:MAG: restriction endonuclease subunit S [Lactobacillus sp.]|uniref:restriction endonuclease subunit S n=1 Tax=Lactobacillus sp. TaxID=1591 RepID=UPI0023CB2346|nr:restriction endonuclease subunit S [Lactobacillus sp.]MDE7050933.1 restriction endonuclease subunit S [Lactobacillus sp.]